MRGALMFTDVAPVRPVPVRVTGTTVPGKPVLGVIAVSVTPGGVTTVNVTVLLVPAAVVTLTVLAPSTVLAAIAKVAVTVVLFTTVTLLTVMRGALVFTEVVPVRLVPVRVTVSVLLREPVLGLIEVSVGAGIGSTVNVSLLLVPVDVVTLTFLPVRLAVFEMAKFAVTVVLFTAVTPLTVMPLPDTFTAVVLIRLVPVRVTATVVPRRPEVGAIEVNVGAGGAGIWNSTAPTSKAPRLPGSGRGLPKKSLLGAAKPAADVVGT